MRIVDIDSHTRIVYDRLPGSYEYPVFVSTTRANLDAAFDDAQQRHGYPLDRGLWEEGDDGAMVCTVFEDDEVRETRLADEARTARDDARATKYDERGEGR